MDTKSGVVVLAGTNRSDVLDKALIRAGRFDRQISIDLPDMKARQDIFMVHLKVLKLVMNPIDYAPRLAQLTPGFSGADIANVCNEAALVAARYGASAVHWKQFEQAIDRVIAGLERKTRILSPEEKKTVAYHEAGHAVAGWFLQHADPLLKVSLFWGNYLVVFFCEIETKGLDCASWKRNLGICSVSSRGPKSVHSPTTGRQDVHGFGRASFRRTEFRPHYNGSFGRFGQGDQNGIWVGRFLRNGRHGPTVIQNSTGGNKSCPNCCFLMFLQGDVTIGKPYSEDTAAQIDEEVMKMIRKCYDRTKELLQSKMAEIDALAKLLIEKEVVSREEVEGILGKRLFASESATHQWAGRLEKPSQEKQ